MEFMPYILLFTKGIGTWGVNNSVGWGWAIVNFVWWIGIGHAGTAFSIFPPYSETDDGGHQSTGQRKQ